MKSDSMVLFLRLLVSGYIRVNPQKFEDFLDKGTTLEVYCMTEVEPLEKEPDQVNPQILFNCVASTKCLIDISGRPSQNL